MQEKKQILLRIYLVYIIVVLASLAVLYKVLFIQFFEADKWQEKAENLAIKNIEIKAVRGNIYSDNGRLLATSVPKYEIALDLTVPDSALFYNKVDSLSMQLSDIFKDKSAREYSKKLRKGRADERRYMSIKRNVTYSQLKKIKQFHIINKGRFKGGLIVIKDTKRVNPFGILAFRSIGYERITEKNNGNNDTLKVGLEGGFSKELSGISGIRLVQKISQGDWKPISDENQVDPKDGYDIHTTIDVNIQDVAENALLTQLKKHNAAHGCVVLMEVKTGHIKAIANLKKVKDSTYFEIYNHAVGERTEPGSTIKLASYITAMEDGYIKPTDIIETGNGKLKFYDRWMKDSHEGGHGDISAKNAFAYSSNIAIAKIVDENYSDDPQNYIDGLKRLKINEPTGIEIPGERKPFIKNAEDSLWSGITLPWMAHGYELELTPLQILTFYNSIANNGYRVNPMLVTEVRDKGNLIKKFESNISDDPICSEETLKSIKEMLEAVVEYGTASNLNAAHYKIAGKTGTSVISKKSGYRREGKSYQASFVGYFPADAPQYTCIVVVNAPSNYVYYGNLVAGPIFKEISDKVYSTSTYMHDEIALNNENIKMPVSKNGYKSDLDYVFNELEIKQKNLESDKDWVKTSCKDEYIEISELNIEDTRTPNVKGMTLQDAVYILESKGYRVISKGRGFVKSQRIVQDIVYLELKGV